MRAKAILLLVIFMLNSVAGFSCVLHMAYGCDTPDHMHTTSYAKEDLCCKALMGAHIVQGKLIPETGKVLIQLPAIWIERPAAQALIFAAGAAINHNEFIDYWSWPPQRDIRIAIQSFQI